MSAAEIVAALFFAEMRFDPKDPQHPEADRFVLSKGHARADPLRGLGGGGLFPRAELLNLRKITSDLEGHPTPRLPFVDVATGSLGQGLRAARRDRAQRAPHQIRLPHVRAAGRRRERGGIGVGSGGSRREPEARQSVRASPTSTASARAARRSGVIDLEAFTSRWHAFGWHAIAVDGHDLAAILAALGRSARKTKGRPTMIVAGTFKGKGVSRSSRARTAGTASRSRRAPEARPGDGGTRSAVVKTSDPAPVIPKPASRRIEGPLPDVRRRRCRAPAYKLGEQRRDARGVRRGARGARRHRSAHRRARRRRRRTPPSARSSRRRTPNGSIEVFIAEQVMIGVAMGLAAAARFRSRRRLRASSSARATSSAWPGISNLERQAGRVARRRVDWRGRAVADGARGSRDGARRAELHGAVSVRRGERRRG